MTTLREELAISIFGVPARAFAVHTFENGRIPNQTIKTESREYTKRGVRFRIRAELRFDDNCKNGHETFAITGSIDRFERGAWHGDAGGCIHEEIEKHFPELAPLIKWHLVSVDGPMHYTANAVYLAGERDCHGLLKGESRQLRDRETGIPAWKLEPVGAKPEPYVDAETQPAAPLFHYVPWTRIGEGKARELDAARRVAVWPEATDAELMQEPAQLTATLKARLPALLAEFKTAMLAAGFIWPADR